MYMPAPHKSMFYPAIETAPGFRAVAPCSSTYSSTICQMSSSSLSGEMR
ncbi:hypothetical protein GGP86_003114 [Salinibacter ruber]|nr:hypothetical protein [Salinibacter ruber]